MTVHCTMILSEYPHHPLLVQLFIIMGEIKIINTNFQLHNCSSFYPDEWISYLISCAVAKLHNIINALIHGKFLITEFF